MSEFTKGQTVYSLHGTEGEYVSAVSGGHIVRPIYEVGDGEPAFGSIEEWRAAYAVPPTEKLHADVLALNLEINRLREMKLELQKQDQNIKDHMAKLKRHEKLQLLEEFLDGKITHYAVFPEYREPYVLPLEKALSNPENRNDNAMRLLSLYGQSKGELHWKLHQYSDGSGSSRDEVIPCTSLEQAQELVKAKIKEAFDLWMKDQSKSVSPLNKYASAAVSLGMEVPVEISTALRALKIKNAQAFLNQQTNAMQRAKAALEAIE